MLAALLQEKPKVVSFHFGVPAPERVRALRDAGIILLASATNPNEAQAVADAGVHAVVAQGYEAGGHRGVFNTNAPDSSLGTIALTRLLARQLDIPVIAAGGIMDGAGIAAGDGLPAKQTDELRRRFRPALIWCATTRVCSFGTENSGNSWANCVAGTVSPGCFLEILSEAGFEEAAFLGTTGYRTSPENPRILIYRGKIRLK